MELDVGALTILVMSGDVGVKDYLPSFFSISGPGIHMYLEPKSAFIRDHWWSLPRMRCWLRLESARGHKDMGGTQNQLTELYHACVKAVIPDSDLFKNQKAIEELFAKRESILRSDLSRRGV